MTAFAIDVTDLAFCDVLGVGVEDVAAYVTGMQRARLVLISRGWEDDELYSAQLFDLPTGPEKSSLLRLREDLQLPTDPDAYLMSTPLGARIPRPE